MNSQLMLPQVLFYSKSLVTSFHFTAKHSYQTACCCIKGINYITSVNNLMTDSAFQKLAILC